MVRRALFERSGGFDPRHQGVEDVDFHVRAARWAGFAYCAQPLSIHHWDGQNVSRPGEQRYRDLLRHLQLALSAPDYSDLRAEIRPLLRARYRWLVFYYGRHRQPRQAWATLRASQEAGFDAWSALCALGAWLGPLPFMAVGRLLWPKH